MATGPQSRARLIEYLADKAVRTAAHERRVLDKQAENRAFVEFMSELQGRDSDYWVQTSDVVEVFDRLYEAGNTTVTQEVRDLFNEYWWLRT